jgi:hypothetical protein
MMATPTCITDLGGESLCRIHGEQPQNKVNARLGYSLPLQPIFKVSLSAPPQSTLKEINRRPSKTPRRESLEHGAMGT